MKGTTSLFPSKETQDVDEDHDDVHVDVEGSEYVFFWRNTVFMITSHHELSIIDQVHGEEESSCYVTAL